MACAVGGVILGGGVRGPCRRCCSARQGAADSAQLGRLSAADAGSHGTSDAGAHGKAAAGAHRKAAAGSPRTADAGAPRQAGAAPLLHLPLQRGAARVLEHMRRRHTAAE